MSTISLVVGKLCKKCLFAVVRKKGFLDREGDKMLFRAEEIKLNFLLFQFSFNCGLIVSRSFPLFLPNLVKNVKIKLVQNEKNKNS